MFFIMSFAFVRGSHQSTVSAGLHLSTIPIMIGITAPISGRLYEKFGSRILTTVGMALCSVAIVLLANGADRMDPGFVAGGGERLRYSALGLASTSRQIMQPRWRQLLTDETPRPEDC
jgi:MFS family permease